MSPLAANVLTTNPPPAIDVQGAELLPAKIMQDAPGGACVLHGTHSPRNVISELHHVFPVYLQAKVWPDGKVRDPEKRPICSTSHNTVHYGLSYVLEHGTWPTDCARGSAHDLAAEGLRRYQAALAVPSAS